MRVNGVELSVADEGTGPVVCFSHGLLWSKEMYRPQIEALKSRYRCVSWDHRGQGQSEVPPGRIVTIDQVAEDAAALIEQLDVGPVHFVGLSMGGFTGLRLAARRPDLLRSLTLIESAGDAESAANVPKYRRLGWAARVFGVNRWLASRVMPIMFGPTFLNDPARAALRDEWRSRLMANKRSITKAVNGVIERDGVMNELASIQCPTLVLHGVEDRAIAIERAVKTCDAIDGARLVRIERAGHTSTIENPQAITKHLAEFLDGLETSKEISS